MDLHAVAAKLVHAQVAIALATRMDLHAMAEQIVSGQIRIALAINAPIERKLPPDDTQHTGESVEVLPLLQDQEMMASFGDPAIASQPMLVSEWMQIVETFASEVLTAALARVVNSYASPVVAVASQNDSAQQEAESDEIVSALPLPVSAKAVSRRQLIHQVAKATNAGILSIVMQHVVASREVNNENTASESVIDDHKDQEQKPTDDAHSDAPETVRVATTPPLREDDLVQGSEAGQDEPLLVLEPPPASPPRCVEENLLEAAVDRPLLCSRIAQSFVHDLLIVAATTANHIHHPLSAATEMLPLSIEPPMSPTATTTHESMSSVRGGRQNKSLNVHKRHLVRKDTAAPAVMRSPSPPPALRPMLSPSLPTLLPSPSKAAAPSEQDELVPVVSESLEPTKVHIKRKKEEHHTTHHSPHSQRQKPPAAAAEDSEGGEAGDRAIPEENTPSKVNSTKSPREETGFHINTKSDSAASLIASPPVSSARQAKEIYRPRRNLIEPPASKSKLHRSHKHPRRHPHHIGNAAIHVETSYSRDSPRADAIAEMQKSASAALHEGERGGQMDQVELYLVLPRTKVVRIPAVTTTATKSALSSSSSTSPSGKAKAKDQKTKSPVKMRSGYCQQCVFEERSCKINDCLKHQLLTR